MDFETLTGPRCSSTSSKLCNVARSGLVLLSSCSLTSRLDFARLPASRPRLDLFMARPNVNALWCWSGSKNILIIQTIFVPLLPCPPPPAFPSLLFIHMNILSCKVRSFGIPTPATCRTQPGVNNHRSTPLHTVWWLILLFGAGQWAFIWSASLETSCRANTLLESSIRKGREAVTSAGKFLSGRSLLSSHLTNRTGRGAAHSGQKLIQKAKRTDSPEYSSIVVELLRMGSHFWHYLSSLPLFSAVRLRNAI